MKASEFQIHSTDKLDGVLTELCQMIINGKKKNPEYYGMVAAAVLDPDNNLVMSINHYDDATDKRVHAERAAVEKYNKKFGTVPSGSIVITTLSPCSEDMVERYGESCTDFLNNLGVHKVYCGYDDPTQHPEHKKFHTQETRNEKLKTLCKQFADTFLKKLNEATNPVEEKPMPHLYLDMDGVQADFFGAWADMHKVPSYKHINNPENAIEELAASGEESVYKFFRNLRPLNGGQRIIKWLHQHNIPFTVLSAPLRGNSAHASIAAKKDWLDIFNPGTSSNAIFTSAKYKHAKTNGQPNVLVDDFGKYLNAWHDAGGIAVKHEDGNTDRTLQQLAKIYGITQ